MYIRTGVAKIQAFVLWLREPEVGCASGTCYRYRGCKAYKKESL